MISRLKRFVGFVFLVSYSISLNASTDKDNHEQSQQNSALFDIAVYNTCQALENGMEKQAVDRLLRAGIKPEIHYFDILCPNSGLMLSASLQHHNFRSAQYLLRYLRWRERETNNTVIRDIILNAPNRFGETLVDITQQKISSNQDIATSLELTSFLSLFKRHGGRCLKYCNP